MTEQDVLRQWRDPGCDYIDVRTSGSTGTPKHLKLPKSLVLASALRTNDFFNISTDSFLYSLVSPDFIGGKMMAIRADVAGCDYHFETPSNHPQIVAGQCISLLAVVPSQMWHILDNLAALPQIDAIIIGGAPIPPELKERIVASGLNAFETYGMTETASHIALRKVGETLFQTLPGIEVSLSENATLRISSDETGEIVTNDLAEIPAAGRFRILGRADNVIVTGAKKVIPEEIEAIAHSFFPRIPLAVSWRHDPLWGQRVVLVAENPIDESIRKDFENSLLPHQRPKEYIRINEIPVTTNGKTDRQALAKLIKTPSNKKC